MTTGTAATAKTETPKPDAPDAGQSLQLGNVGPRSGAIEVGSRGLQLSNLDDAWKFCTAMAASGMMPKGMETAQKILYALELGFEVGLPPLAAVQSIAVINGRASLYGDVMLGLVIASGKFDEEAFEETVESDQGGAPVKATCTVRRLPNGKLRTSEFTMADAKTAGLMGKEGPWRNYPRRMLQMRARGFALRDAFPDVLRGIISREEAMDLPPEKNVTPAPAATSSPTNLDDLTEQLNGSATVVATQETVAEGGSESQGPDTQAAGAEAGAADRVFEEILRSLGDTLAECKYVTDVTKQRNLILANNTLTNQQRKDVEELCEARASEIKNAKRGDAKGQPSLV